jgi:hypothetical protein
MCYYESRGPRIDYGRISQGEYEKGGFHIDGSGVPELDIFDTGMKCSPVTI